ncbi:MAG TPA: ATP-binding protein [Sphingomicrobium sp.]
MAIEARLSVDATFEQVREIAAFVRRAAEAAGLAPAAVDDLEIAAVEAANNIVFHGYSGSAGSIEVSAGTGPQGFCVELVDDAPGFAEHTFDAPASTSSVAESGRGVAILRACTDALEYSRIGTRNHLRLIKAG